MNGIVRWIRGAVGVGVGWALGWGRVGGVLGLSAVAFDLVRVGDPLVVDLGIAAVTTVLGAGSAGATLLIARGGASHELSDPPEPHTIEAAREPPA